MVKATALVSAPQEFARRILWLVTGAEKTSVLPRLIAGDGSIPAGRVPQDQAVLLADQAAARGLPPLSVG